MTQIIDFSKSSLTSFSQTIAIPVLAAPASNTLTQFGLATAQGGSVLLNASIGVQTVLGSPNLLFTILRAGAPVFTLRTTALSTGQYDLVSLSYVDASLPAGYFAYTLTVSLVNSSVQNAVNLIGPVDFSGLSLV
ncbi:MULTISPECIES: hypothetical protein [Paenibacillus]|uniref:hypothetical protein n=1 Tax=Paenibacillus TaxID=44249 RepID=UPI00096CA8D4|nr:hypothetical protein [Paenibacillus sp. FSL H8-0259]OMF23957.1 hypothetical protein BK132_25240 [Paenibacillus sp. FSL H8-0259]